MSDETVGLDFDSLDPISIPVRIGGKRYTLREASGDAGAKITNMRLRGAKLGPDGRPVSVDGLGDVMPLTVSMCLFDESGKSVPVNTVRQWPLRIVRELFRKASEISELDKDDEDEDAAKNGQGDTTDGSASPSDSESHSESASGEPALTVNT